MIVFNGIEINTSQLLPKEVLDLRALFTARLSKQGFISELVLP
jgi:hypothetical protein